MHICIIIIVQLRKMFFDMHHLTDEHCCLILGSNDDDIDADLAERMSALKKPGESDMDYYERRYQERVSFVCSNNFYNFDLLVRGTENDILLTIMG